MLPMDPVQDKCWRSRGQQYGSSLWSGGIVPPAGVGGCVADVLDAMVTEYFTGTETAAIACDGGGYLRSSDCDATAA